MKITMKNIFELADYYHLDIEELSIDVLSSNEVVLRDKDNNIWGEWDE